MVEGISCDHFGREGELILVVVLDLLVDLDEVAFDAILGKALHQHQRFLLGLLRPEVDQPLRNPAYDEHFAVRDHDLESPHHENQEEVQDALQKVFQGCP